VGYRPVDDFSRARYRCIEIDHAGGSKGKESRKHADHRAGQDHAEKHGSAGATYRSAGDRSAPGHCPERRISGWISARTADRRGPRRKSADSCARQFKWRNYDCGGSCGPIAYTGSGRFDFNSSKCGAGSGERRGKSAAGSLGSRNL
jgi:hypothetical protein